MRLLPMIAGMLAGTQLAPLILRRTGARPLIATGFVLSAAALGLAATTQAHSGYRFAAAWITLLGTGIGLALPASMNAAVGALSAEPAGAASGLLQALRQVGGAIGVAVLGTVLNSGYRGQLGTSQVPGSLSSAARSSVAAGVQVAARLSDGPLLHAVRTAFVHGMDLTFIVCGALSLAGAVLALLSGPRRTPPPAPSRAGLEESVHEPAG